MAKKMKEVYMLFSNNNNNNNNARKRAIDVIDIIPFDAEFPIIINFLYMHICIILLKIFRLEVIMIRLTHTHIYA